MSRLASGAFMEALDGARKLARLDGCHRVERSESNSAAFRYEPAAWMRCW